MPTIGGFNWFDVLLLFLVGFGLTVGYAQGLLRQVMGLAALYIATIIATQYFIPFSNFLRSVLFLTESRLWSALAFFLILLGVTSIINFLAADAYRLTKSSIYPLVDHLGGMVLGLITILITLSLVLPILIFVTSEPMPYFDSVRSDIAAGMQTARMMPLFQAIKPIVLSAITPWIPGGLPSLFNL
jgi:uncharacterized membrane protein required for colicin V production